MASGESGVVLRQVRAIFGSEAVAGMTDAQLLERFASCRDDVAGSAFEAIVVRHGPMVLGVCRSMIRDPHEAEDAFQATFLVLVRKARAIWVKDSLSGWLSSVAYRVAARSRAISAKRKSRESAMGDHDPEGGPADDNDLRVMIHEEIGRLPEQYRVPIVLCHLEGRTHEEAAHQLRWPVGTVRSRLARGRERLKGRLARRGLGPVSAGVVALSAPELAPASVSPALLESTVKAATSFAARGAFGAGLVSASAVALSEGVLWTMFVTKLKLVGMLALGAGLLLAGAQGIAMSQQAEAGRVQPVSAREAARAEAETSALAARDNSATARPESERASDSPQEKVAAPQPEQAPRPNDARGVVPPPRPQGGAAGSQDAVNAGETARGSNSSSFELEVRLKAAQAKFERINQLYKNAVVSDGELQEVRLSVDAVIAEIQAREEELHEQLELLNARLQVKQAELDEASAAALVAKSKLVRAEAHVKQGAVSREEAEQIEGDARLTEARRQGKMAEVNEVRIRINHTERRLGRVTKLIARTRERATPDGDGAKPAPSKPAAAEPAK